MINMIFAAALMTLPPLNAEEKGAVDCLRVAAWLDKNAVEQRYRDGAHALQAFYFGELHILDANVHWPNAVAQVTHNVPKGFALGAGKACVTRLQDEISEVGLVISDPAIRLIPPRGVPK